MNEVLLPDRGSSGAERGVGAARRSVRGRLRRPHSDGVGPRRPERPNARRPPAALIPQLRTASSDFAILKPGMWDSLGMLTICSSRRFAPAGDEAVGRVGELQTARHSGQAGPRRALVQ